MSIWAKPNLLLHVGNRTVDDNGELITVGPGDVVVTGDAYHAVVNAGSEPLIFTAVIIRH
jgi:oxalate decarboxylase/phosphoglucose isomerase-like protein (cupin superfamily)